MLWIGDPGVNDPEATPERVIQMSMRIPQR